MFGRTGDGVPGSSDPANRTKDTDEEIPARGTLRR
jgi:hypothetical protein